MQTRLDGILSQASQGQANATKTQRLHLNTTAARINNSLVYHVTCTCCSRASQSLPPLSHLNEANISDALSSNKKQALALLLHSIAHTPLSLPICSTACPHLIKADLKCPQLKW